MSLKESALMYRNKFCFSVIPMRPDKIPFIKWEKYQRILATENELRLWWRKWPEANIGIITGKLSGIAVINVDAEEASTKYRSLFLTPASSPCVRLLEGDSTSTFATRRMLTLGIIAEQSQAATSGQKGIMSLLSRRAGTRRSDGVGGYGPGEATPVPHDRFRENHNSQMQELAGRAKSQWPE